jgi:hypothetical protein
MSTSPTEDGGNTLVRDVGETARFRDYKTITCVLLHVQMITPHLTVPVFRRGVNDVFTLLGFCAG